MSANAIAFLSVDVALAVSEFFGLLSFIMLQHAMHADCDIVLPILSVCVSVRLSSVVTVSK